MLSLSITTMGSSKQGVEEPDEIQKNNSQPPAVPQHQENLFCSHCSILFILTIKLHIYKSRTSPVSTKTSHSLKVTLITLLDH